jgi:hypothetical protein
MTGPPQEERHPRQDAAPSKSSTNPNTSMLIDHSPLSGLLRTTEAAQ